MTILDKSTAEFLNAMTVDNETYTKYVQHEILATLKQNFMKTSNSDSIKIVDKISEEIFKSPLSNHVKSTPMASIIPKDKDVSQIYIEQANKICQRLGMNVLINPEIPKEGFSAKDFVIIDVNALDLLQNRNLYSIHPQEDFSNVNGMFLLDTTSKSFSNDGKNAFLSQHVNKWIVMKNFVTSVTLSENDLNELSGYLRTKMYFKALPTAPEQTFKPEFYETGLYKSLYIPKVVEKPVIWNNHDLLVEINLPGAGTLSYISTELRNAGITYDRFTIKDPNVDLIHHDVIKNNIERVKDKQVLILDFEFPLNKDTAGSMKQTIQQAKEAGLQVVVAVPNRSNNIMGPSSTTHQFANEKDLFTKIDDLSQDHSLKDTVVNAMKSMKQKLGFSRNNDELGGLPNKKM